MGEIVNKFQVICREFKIAFQLMCMVRKLGFITYNQGVVIFCFVFRDVKNISVMFEDRISFSGTTNLL